MPAKPRASARASEERLADISSPPPSEVRLGGTREQRRSRRKHAVRAHSICVKRLTKLEIALGRMLFPDEGAPRPKTRADCGHGERPCPFVSCAHHLYLDVLARTGAIKLNFPDLEVWEMTETCSLDVADRGGATLEDVGAIMNLTRERIRQLEVTGLAKLQALDEMKGMRDHAGSGEKGKRRLPVIVDGTSAASPRRGQHLVEEEDEEEPDAEGEVEVLEEGW